MLNKDIKESMLFHQFSLLALNTFKWEGSDRLKSRYIEKALYEKGMAVVFNDENFGLMVLPCTIEGEKNIYGEPIRVMAHGYDKTFSLDTKNCVIIRNNDLCIPTLHYIYDYAERISIIESLINRNLIQQHFPYVFEGDSNTKFTIKNIFNNFRKNEEMFIVNKKIMNNGKLFHIENLDVPFLIPDLHAYRQKIFNELLNFLGINSNPIEKKERMIVDEVNSNNDYIDRNLDLFYKSRQEALEEINNKFNLNMTLKLRRDSVNVSQLHAHTFRNNKQSED